MPPEGCFPALSVGIIHLEVEILSVAYPKNRPVGVVITVGIKLVIIWYGMGVGGW